MQAVLQREKARDVIVRVPSTMKILFAEIRYPQRKFYPRERVWIRFLHFFAPSQTSRVSQSRKLSKNAMGPFPDWRLNGDKKVFVYTHPHTSRAHIHTHTRTHTHTEAHTYIKRHRYTPIHIHTHTQIHTRMHTHTDTDDSLEAKRAVQPWSVNQKKDVVFDIYTHTSNTHTHLEDGSLTRDNGLLLLSQRLIGYW